jgi:hypothetical protein
MRRIDFLEEPLVDNAEIPLNDEEISMIGSIETEIDPTLFAFGEIGDGLDI